MDIPRIIQALTTRIQALETMKKRAKPKSTMFDYVTRRDTGGRSKVKDTWSPEYKLAKIWEYFINESNHAFHQENYAWTYPQIWSDFNQLNIKCNYELIPVLCDLLPDVIIKCYDAIRANEPYGWIYLELKFHMLLEFAQFFVTLRLIYGEKISFIMKIARLCVNHFLDNRINIKNVFSEYFKDKNNRHVIRKFKQLIQEIFGISDE